MKKAYFVDITNLNDPDATIIDETTLEVAERGENYLNPDDFIFHGEFASPEEARQAHWNERGDALYCYQHDC